MAVIAWPIWMPQDPLLDGYSRSWRDNIEAFQPERGPAITGPMSAKIGADVTACFAVTSEAADLFRKWWQQTLRGAREFQWLDPHVGTVETYRPKPGNGLQEDDIGGGFYTRFTLNLEQLP